MTVEEREDAVNYFKNKLENEVYGAKYNKLAIEALEQESTEKKYSKTCGTCEYFRKHQNKEDIEICKKLFGENTICGYCTYWEDTHEVALPTIEYHYCSNYEEVEE